MADPKDKLIKLTQTSTKIIEAQKEESRRIEEERQKAIEAQKALSSPS